MSVMRAGRIRYSTRAETPRARRRDVLVRVRRRSGADRRQLGRWHLAGWRANRLDSHARVAPTGVAFGPPMPMIRHRFGGNLRAVRTGAPSRRPSRTALRRPPSLLPSAEGSPGRRRIGQRVGRAGRPGRAGVEGSRPRSTGATRSTSVRGGECMKYGKVGAFAAVGVLVLAGCNQGAGAPAAARARQHRHRAPPAGQRARGLGADHQRHQARREGRRRRRPAARRSTSRTRSSSTTRRTASTTRRPARRT